MKLLSIKYVLVLLLATIIGRPQSCAQSKGAVSSPQQSSNNQSRPKTIKVKEGDTISGLIEKHYSIGMNNPQYMELQKHVQRLNGLSKPEQLQQGNLLLPSIPNKPSPSLNNSRVQSFPFATTAYDGPDNTTEERKLIVQFKLQSLYSESQTKLKEMSDLGLSLPPTLLNDAASQSNIQLVTNQFKLNKYSKESTRVLSSVTDKLNANKTTSRRRLLPSLPPQQHNGDAFYDQAPYVVFKDLRGINAASQPTSYAFNKMLAFYANSPSKESIAEYELTASQVKLLSAIPALNKAMIIRSDVLNIKLADNDPIPPKNITESYHLDPTERFELAKLLNSKPRKPVYLLIQDTGWPNQEMQMQSISNIWHILDFIWGKYVPQMPKHKRTFPSFSPPSNDHCVKVYRSISNFTAIDQSNAIRLVFLPLIREQNADTLLTEILQLYFVLTAANSNPDRLTATSKGLLDEQYTKARKIVNSLPKQWEGQLVVTDQAIIGAIVEIFTFYSKNASVRYFLNHSWTASSNKYEIKFPEPMNGMLVAAAGNESGQDVFSSGIDFARRCLNHGDTIGVLNVVEKEGLRPSSSDLLSPFVDNAWVAGFDGRLDNIEGTSFSAPRLAWLLAASESLDSKTHASYDWPQYIKLLLKNSRSTESKKFFISPIKLLNQSINK